MIQETNLLITPLEKIITRNLMTGKAAQVLSPTEIGGSVQLLVGIENPFRTHTENFTDLTIQPTIVNFNQATEM